MRVAVVTGTHSAMPMGLETAETRLLAALAAAGGGTAIDVRVVGGRGAYRYARRLGARWYPARPGRVPGRAWRRADLVHLAGLTLPPPPDRPFVATVHDMSPLRFRDEGTLPPWTDEIAARAARVITVSRFTAAEIEKLLGVPPERIRVVPNGSGHDVTPTTEQLTDAELAALGLRRPFVLRMGGYTARKNVGLLLAAWPALRRRHDVRLALVGPAQAARQRHLAEAPSLEGVAVLDYLPATIVPRLIRSAAVLVSCSRYEGFGLPMLEGMAAGTPVVAVRAGFSEEVCADAALLVGDDQDALAGALDRVLSDPDLRARLCRAGPQRAASFSWQRAADATLGVYRQAAAARALRSGAAGAAA